MSQKFEHITIIGTGKAAKTLINYFKLRNYPIQLIIGRNEEKLKQLAIENNVNYLVISDSGIEINTDLILVCVSDNAISEIVTKIKTNDCVAHISGTTDISVLEKFENHCVFYPLQTMSQFSEVNSLKIPFLLDCNNIELVNKFKNTFSTENIVLNNSEDRKKYHLAAVMVNNFTNMILVAAQDYCHKNNLNFDLLKPLLNETLLQNLKHSAQQLQTGPAKRKDYLTINKHLDMLKNDPQLMEFYKMISGLIENRFE